MENTAGRAKSPESFGPGEPAKPLWIRRPLSSGTSGARLEETLERFGLYTVCGEAQCPNRGECWGQGTAAFMLMGKVCTRSCRFCAVASGKTGEPLRADQAEAVAAAAGELRLRHVVLTSVDRDDLDDRGASCYAAAVAALRRRIPGVRVEALVPDYRRDELAVMARAFPDVLAHNVETVRSLQHIRDGRASFDGSLETLKGAKEAGIPVTKSSLLLGLGEKREEVLAAMDELREAGVTSLVMGQYLRPGKRQIPVVEYLHPDTFACYAEEARARGFSRVISAPFARTSYHAAED
ncbi:MAG: lipoyl synthase [Treponema sp.]|jgi:lipoic acid synthetase|nr:lipoyl synthase [Treponema sp.]